MWILDDPLKGAKEISINPQISPWTINLLYPGQVTKSVGLALKRSFYEKLVQYQFSANLHNLWEIQWQVECLEREMNWHDMHWGYPFMLGLIKYSFGDFLSAKCNSLSVYTGYRCSTCCTCTRCPPMKSKNQIHHLFRVVLGTVQDIKRQWYMLDSSFCTWMSAEFSLFTHTLPVDLGMNQDPASTS